MSYTMVAAPILRHTNDTSPLKYRRGTSKDTRVCPSRRLAALAAGRRTIKGAAMVYPLSTSYHRHTCAPRTPELASTAGRQTIRLAVVSDHPLVRQGLRAVARVTPGLELVGEARGDAEAVGLAAATRPDVVLFDLALPEAPSLAAVAAIKRASPRTCVIVLATFADPNLAPSVAHAGADQVVLKDVGVPDLIRAIRSARPVLHATTPTDFARRF